MAINRVILTGNLTKDPDVQVTSNGIAVAKFTLAVQRRFQNANGERETDFINIVVWRNLANTCGEYLHKGSKCGIVGSIQVRNYDDKDGNKRYVTEIVADEVEFLSPKQEQGEMPQSKAKASLKPVDKDLLDDCPF